MVNMVFVSLCCSGMAKHQCCTATELWVLQKLVFIPAIFVPFPPIFKYNSLGNKPVPVERRVAPYHVLKLRLPLVFLPPVGFGGFEFTKNISLFFIGKKSLPVVFLHQNPSKMIEMPPSECCFIFASPLCLLLIYGSSFVSSINKSYIFSWFHQASSMNWSGLGLICCRLHQKQ